MTEQAVTDTGDGSGRLQRSITWKGAFWVAAGVPALVLFSIGGIAATVGVPSWLVWAISVCFGLRCGGMVALQQTDCASVGVV